jgi:hypothetical protein
MIENPRAIDSYNIPKNKKGHKVTTTIRREHCLP